MAVGGLAMQSLGNHYVLLSFSSASFEYITCMYDAYLYIFGLICQGYFVSEITFTKMGCQSITKHSNAPSVGKIIAMYCMFWSSEGHAGAIFPTPVEQYFYLHYVRFLFRWKSEGIINRIFPIVLKAVLCMLFRSVKDCMYPELWLCIYFPTS